MHSIIEVRVLAFVVGTGMGLICQQVITLSLYRLG